MPAILVQALAGRGVARKRELARRITDAVVDVYGVLPQNVTVRFQESGLEDFARAGVLASDSPEMRQMANLAE